MILLVDMDGVLVDFETAFHTSWRVRHPDAFHIPPAERRRWDLAKEYPPECEDRINELIRTPGFFLQMQPMPGARAAMHEALELGVEVRICSAPMRQHPTCAHEKIAWVERHLGDEFVDRVILTRDKTLVHGDILIDDKHAVTGVRAPTWEHVYFDAPYTRPLTDRRRVHWGNWREVLLGR